MTKILLSSCRRFLLSLYTTPYNHWFLYWKTSVVLVNWFVFEVVLGARTLELPPCVEHCLLTDTISTTALHSASTECTQGCGPGCGNTGRLETWKVLAFSKTNLKKSYLLLCYLQIFIILKDFTQQYLAIYAFQNFFEVKLILHH